VSTDVSIGFAAKPLGAPTRYKCLVKFLCKPDYNVFVSKFEHDSNKKHEWFLWETTNVHNNQQCNDQ